MNLILAAAFGISGLTAHADITNAAKLEKKYVQIAQSVNADFTPSASEGKIFFNRKFKLNNGKEAACASCHTTNPADSGKHIVTGKLIRPLSPTVNSKRFTDLDKVEEKFTEHCNDILGADCSAAEKANFIVYLMSENTPSAKK
ncbi:MAG TPA: DUF1924 domain-containing protein [Methylophilus sp.]|nr:DUF1924 domain-containing protein [Methylophilus sp.]HQQ32330.1 DUF1924 domain-containing protein [Methylophilus sp.]